MGSSIGEWTNQEKGTKQGDPISSTLFITYLERVIERLQDIEKGVSAHGYFINSLRFVDDIDVLVSSWEDLQEMVDIISEDGKKAGLIINERKTETLVFGTEGACDSTRLKTRVIKDVDQFLYLGSLRTWNNDVGTEVNRRIGIAEGVMAGFNAVWKLKLLQTYVFSILIYACETWTLKKNGMRRLFAFEMRCYRRLFNVKWYQSVPNREVSNKVK